MAKIGIIGAGTWGTALAVLLNNNGHEVTIWSIIPEEVEMLRTKRQHEKKLPGVIWHRILMSPVILKVP